jgi:hypothetical protein
MVEDGGAYLSMTISCPRDTHDFSREGMRVPDRWVPLLISVLKSRIWESNLAHTDQYNCSPVDLKKT